MADNNSKKYLSGDNLKYTLQQLKTKIDELYVSESEIFDTVSNEVAIPASDIQEQFNIFDGALNLVPGEIYTLVYNGKEYTDDCSANGVLSFEDLSNGLNMSIWDKHELNYLEDENDYECVKTGADKFVITQMRTAADIVLKCGSKKIVKPALLPDMATKEYVDDAVANAGTQSDWNETDPTAASYIQNRTHGESDDTWVVYAEGNFNNRQQVNEQGYDDGYLWDSVNISTIKTGEIMRVTFDGQVYECPALKIDRMIYFGNGAAVNYVGQKFESLSDLVSNDEPFFCYLYPEGTSTTYSQLHIKFKPKPLCSRYSIKVERKGAGVFIIDEKYLPLLIGRPGYNTGAEVFNYSSNEARGLYSHAEGYNTYASGSYSHAEGYGDSMPPDDLENLYILSDEELIDFDSRYAIAAGIASHTEGYFNIAIGEYSHAEGSSTIARGSSSHTEGMSTRAIGSASHAEGEYSVAIEDSSHAEGCGTAAYGYGSHTEGSGSMTTENGYYAHAEGIDTIAASRAQHVQGKWNVEDANNQYAHIVGNGKEWDSETNGELRSNAHTLDWNGNAWFAGNVTIGTDNKKLATEEYVDSAVEGCNTVPFKDYTMDELSGVSIDVNELESFKYYTLPNSVSAAAIMLNYRKEDGTRVQLVFRQGATNAHNTYMVTFNSLSRFTIVEHTYSGHSYAYHYYHNDDSVSMVNMVLPVNNTNKFTPNSEYNLVHKKYVDDAIAANTELVKTNEIIATIPASAISNYTTVYDIYEIVNYNQSIGLVAGKNYIIEFGGYRFACTCVQEGDFVKLNVPAIHPGYSGYDIIQIYDKCQMDTNTTDSIPTENGSTLIFFNDYFLFYYKNTGITDCVITMVEAETVSSLCFEDDVVINNSISIGSSVATGRYASALGIGCNASANASHAEGLDTSALGYCSHSEGKNTVAVGEASHAEGLSLNDPAIIFNKDIKQVSSDEIKTKHQDSYFSLAKGKGSHVEGTDTVALGYAAHAEGDHTLVAGDYSHAEGYKTLVNGEHSHAEGVYTIASGDSQHVEGMYNIEDTENKYIHIAGNGKNDSTTGYQVVRSNAYTLDWDGNAVYAGKITAGAAPTEDMDITTKKYVDDAIAANSPTIDEDELDAIIIDVYGQ